MIALKILDLRDLTSKLFIGETFDQFWLSNATITTYNTFTIDGMLHEDFFEPLVLEGLKRSTRTHSLWREVKPFCYSVIKGKHTPLYFKIVFQLSWENLQSAIAKSGVNLAPEDVNGLFLNFQYNGSELTCTTGSSLRIFTMDKSFDTVWDNMVLAFFRNHGIAFEQF